MEDKTILVTGYFSIGRQNTAIKNLRRDNNKYFKYFKIWARMKNELVVYTQKEFVEEIVSIRESFGLKDKTRVYAIEDIKSLEPDIYKAMERVESKGIWRECRYHINAMSNQAMYDFVMLMKYWFMADAVDKTGFIGNVAWMDFGFNHGNECYIDENDFNFEWEPNITNGITVFAKNNPDESNCMITLMLQLDCLMGSPVIVKSNRTYDLWIYCKEAMEALLAIETIDDDQMLLLMAYKKHAEDFNIIYSDWFLPIRDMGATHMKIREDYGEIKKDRISLKLKKILARIYFFVKGDFSHPEPYDFGKRMRKIARNEK